MSAEGETHKRPSEEDSNEGAALFLDCGSGHTAALAYTHDPASGLVCCAKLADIKLPCLAPTIADGKESVVAWVKLLSQAVRSSTTTFSSVIVGATAGLRSAVDSGTVTQQAIDDFIQALYNSEELVMPVTFKLLTGEEEAQSEHAAVRYIGSKLLPPETMPVGLISSGGMSAQFAYYPDSSSNFVKFLELRTDWKAGTYTVVDAGVEDGLTQINARLAETMASTGLLGKLAGTYFGIEMFADIFEKAGAGGRLLTKEEACLALQEYLEKWREASKELDLETERQDLAAGRKKYPAKMIGDGVLGVQALRQLSLLHDSATLFCSNCPELAPSLSLKPTWSLGLFLLLQTETDDSDAIAAEKARARARFEEEWGLYTLQVDLGMELADRCWAALATSDSVLDATVLASTREALLRWGQGKFDLASLEKRLQHSGQITLAQWRQYCAEACSADSKTFIFFGLSELHDVLLAKSVKQMSSRQCIVHAIGANATTAPIPVGCKLVHFLRHGEGNHNLKGEAKDRKTIDPPLNGTGQEQAAAAHQVAAAHFPTVVVSSPMRRTMETAAIVWAHVSQKAEFICHDGCREGDSNAVKPPENRRRSSAQNAAERYGGVERAVTFTCPPDLVTSDTAAANDRESDAEIARRLHDFMSWLHARPEAHIAVVGHTLVFQWLFLSTMDARDGCAEVRDAMRATWGNCEMRSVLLQLC